MYWEEAEPLPQLTRGPREKKEAPERRGGKKGNTNDLEGACSIGKVQRAVCVTRGNTTAIGRKG